MTSTIPGVRLESVSLGKGHVAWRVHFPPLARRRRQVKKEYARLRQACEAIKAHCRREECEPETVERVEAQAPEIEWGSGLD